MKTKTRKTWSYRASAWQIEWYRRRRSAGWKMTRCPRIEMFIVQLYWDALCNGFFRSRDLCGPSASWLNSMLRLKNTWWKCDICSDLRLFILFSFLFVLIKENYDLLIQRSNTRKNSGDQTGIEPASLPTDTNRLQQALGISLYAWYKFSLSLRRNDIYEKSMNVYLSLNQVLKVNKRCRFVNIKMF